jgi:hypothetical protein
MFLSKAHAGTQHVHSRRLGRTSRRRERRRTAWRRADILAEEEREQAAQTKVRIAPPSPHIGLHSVQLGDERCGVSVARVSAFPLTA